MMKSIYFKNDMFTKSIAIRKHTWDEYLKVAECGKRELFQVGDYLFIDTNDIDDKEHYLFCIWDHDEKKSLFLEIMELKPFYDLIGLYFGNSKFLIETLDEIVNQFIMRKEKIDKVLHEKGITRNV